MGPPWDHPKVLPELSSLNLLIKKKLKYIYLFFIFTAPLEGTPLLACQR